METEHLPLLEKEIGEVCVRGCKFARAVPGHCGVQISREVAALLLVRLHRVR
jgi:hypothetical protein